MPITILTWNPGNARNVTIENNAFDNPLSFAFYDNSTYSAPIGGETFRYTDSTLFTNGSGGLSDLYVPYTLTQTIVNEVITDITTIDILSVGNHLDVIGTDAFLNNTTLQGISWRDEQYSATSMILDKAFENNSNLQSMSLPSSMLILGDSVFNNCFGLSIYNIPVGITSIGAHAFENTAIKGSISFSDSLTYIGASVFKNTNLEFIEFGTGISIIPDEAFHGCSLIDSSVANRLTFPEPMNTIGYGAFYGCSGLSIGGVVFGSSINTIGDFAFNGTSLARIRWEAGTIRTIVTSGNRFTDAGVAGDNFISLYPTSYTTLIGGETFPNNDGDSKTTFFGSLGDNTYTITGIITQSDIITARAVVGEIEGVSIGTLVTSIGSLSDNSTNAPFYGLSHLVSVAFKDDSASTCDKIGAFAFYGCSLLTNDLVLPTSNTILDIGDNAFATSALTDLTLTSGLLRIGENSFELCQGLTNITFPSSLTLIGNSAFKSSGLSSIVLTNNLEEVSDNCFADCVNLEFYDYGTGVSIIGVASFENCTSFDSMVFPNTMIEIGVSAFKGCTGMSFVTMGTGITTVGEDAFAGI
jgi:hypothetical protein